LAEDLISTCIQDALKECAEELAVLRDEKHPLLDLSCKRITYTTAIEILHEHSSCSPKWGDDLGTPHERFLTDEYFKQPVIITHYPRSLKSFYMHKVDDEKTVACFDFLLPGIGEVIGGSQREVRYDVLQKEMEARKMDQHGYQQYLDLRRFGSVPHSGFGLGFERIVRYITGMEHIRDVIPFPVYYEHLSC
jgi:asparaginyl-tRNA synthetase